MAQSATRPASPPVRSVPARSARHQSQVGQCTHASCHRAPAPSPTRGRELAVASAPLARCPEPSCALRGARGRGRAPRPPCWPRRCPLPGQPSALRYQFCWLRRLHTLFSLCSTLSSSSHSHTTAPPVLPPHSHPASKHAPPVRRRRHDGAGSGHAPRGRTGARWWRRRLHARSGPEPAQRGAAARIAVTASAPAPAVPGGVTEHRPVPAPARRGVALPPPMPDTMGKNEPPSLDIGGNGVDGGATTGGKQNLWLSAALPLLAAGVF